MAADEELPSEEEVRAGESRPASGGRQRCRTASTERYSAPRSGR